MKDRIVLHRAARDLTDEELNIVSGGEYEDTGDDSGGGGGGGWGGDWGGGWGGGGAGITGGQPTTKVSSQDPNGPMDQDTSALDF
jgi:hypothetical protein